MKTEALLRELVGCASVNPGDRTGFAPPYGEARMAALLAARLEALGGTVTTVEVAPDRPNVWAVFEGRDPSRTLMLDAHTDTVSHEKMVVDPFAGEVREGRLFGRGACDTKGPMAAMLLGLEAAIEGEGLAYNVIFAATCDEETGGNGARHMAAHGPKADFAIIAEPTELRMVTRHKGVIRADVTMRGRAAHSSTPGLGQNAIYAAARLIARMQATADELGQWEDQGEMGPPSLSVTTIAGGRASNIIPDECVLQIERRVRPEEDMRAIEAAIEAEARDAAEGICETPPEIAWTQFYPPMGGGNEHPFRDAFDTALTAVTGAAPHVAAPYATNGGFYAEGGMPCVVFGPGSATEAHTESESIPLAEIETAAEVYRRLLLG